MKKFIVERKLPGAGNMTPDELKSLSKTSVDIIADFGKPYSWIQSFITDDKMYCVHVAETEDDIREHAKIGNFPVNIIEEIKAIIDPGSAD